MDEKQRKLAEELLFTGEEKPSFVKLLYFGLLDVEQVFPFPLPSKEDEQQTENFLKKFDKFLTEKVDADAIDRQAFLPSSVLDGLGELGVLGYTVAEKYGGLARSQTSYCKVMERLAKACSSTALFVNAHHSIGLKSLVLFGSEEQKKKWLPPLAKGEIYAAFSLTEPNAGSDASGIETKAVYIPEKKCWRLNGLKQWSTNASMAGVLTVMAKTEVQTDNGVEEKVTAFLVTPDMPGFTITDKSLEKVGYRGTWTANFRLDNVDVPEENILGPIGGGLKVCLTVLDYGRTTFGATCTGLSKLLCEKAYSHAKERHQFGRALAGFPLVKKKLAEMAALSYAMESTTYLTAGILDSGEHDIMLEAAVLKVFASDSLWKILYDTMQIYGGRSFFTSEPLERMMRDARLNMIGEGANEVLQAFIGVVGMRDVGMQLKGGLDGLTNPFSNFSSLTSLLKSTFYRLYKPKIPLSSKVLSSEGLRLSLAIRQFGFMVMRLLARYQKDIIEKQFILERICRACISLYTTTAVLSRLDGEITQGNKENLLRGKLYITLALDQFDHAFDEMFTNRDQMIEEVADELSGYNRG